MKKMAWWFKWHRRLGLAAALLIVMLTTTGILINHSQSLGWHLKPVNAHWLAHLYGIPLSFATQGFLVGDIWVSQLDNTIYLNDSELLRCDSIMLGAVRIDEWIAVLCGDSLWLYDDEGEPVEQLRGVPLDARQLGVALDGDQVMLLVATDVGLAQFNEVSGSWITPRSVSEVSWLEPTTLPGSLADVLTNQAPIPGLTQERILLDLHSGRILGNVGVWIIDGAAMVMLMLACSGFFTWFGRFREKSKRNLKS